MGFIRFMAWFLQFVDSKIVILYKTKTHEETFTF
jgi:hypothetical protein